MSVSVGGARHPRAVVWGLCAGYGQHDAQELLRVLLDGLHDDLNQVTAAPPYTAITDPPTDSDQQKSERWWAVHTARHHSVLQSVFGGQLHSTLKCDGCGRVSSAFDPFWDLSLPIPKVMLTPPLTLDPAAASALCAQASKC
jgi:ubiquitin C-terminal hydrolase